MSDSTNAAYLLPPEAYFEPAWLDAERRELFEHTWIFAGVEHDLTSPGDFVTVQVGRAPVVVVRDGAGGLRAFHNTCRHRGLPLAEGNGNCGKALVCPYHRWNYRLDGALQAVPQREQFPELEIDQLGLLPVRVDVWKSIVFVTLDEEIEELSQWMADIDTAFENFHPGELVEVSHQVHDIRANWKLYLENHIDWLHLWYLHADSLGDYDHAAGHRQEFGRHWTSFEAARAPQAQDGRWETVDDDPGLLPIPGLSERETGNGAHFLFPSLTLFTNADYWMVGQLIPVSPTTCQLHLRVFALPGSVATRFEDVLNLVMFEDYRAVEAIQSAIASPAFAVGPLATNYEREIGRFHQHYLEYVRRRDCSE